MDAAEAQRTEASEPPSVPIGRKALAMALSRVPDHPAPDRNREQVRTPGDVAANLIMMAAEEGDIVDRVVLDLGCGTGVLAIGAALAGAAHVHALDIDEAAVEVAKHAAKRAGVTERVDFHVADVTTLNVETLTELIGAQPDTTLMNPPFGAQLAARAQGGDRAFLALAFAASKRVVSLHLAQTQGFLVAFSQDSGFDAGTFGTVQFPIPARFAHHKDLVRHVEVGMYRFVKREH